MKHIIRISISILLIVLFSQCEKPLPVYDNQEGMVNFDPKDAVSHIYSFVYQPDEVMQDTVWLSVTTLGFPEDKPRYFELEQAAPDEDEDKKENDKDKKPKQRAVAGKHFVSFDNAEYKKLLVIPANAVRTQIPVIVLRDVSLKDKGEALLELKIKETDDLKLGYSNHLRRSIIISDELVKPSLWTGMLNYFLLEYGPVKHRFMIKVSGNRWDDEYLRSLHVHEGPSKIDQAYFFYLANFFQKKLDERNEKEGDILKEEDGRIVRFER